MPLSTLTSFLVFNFNIYINFSDPTFAFNLTFDILALFLHSMQIFSERSHLSFGSFVSLLIDVLNVLCSSSITKFTVVREI